jgi:histidine triad (HIT) family protein
MYNHAPPDYHCPLCALVRGEADTEWSTLADIVLRQDRVFVLISAVWWPRNPGHVVVVPNEHFENIFDLPAALASDIHSAARKIALAFKATYKCDGISTRQHNEPAGNQDVWHYHLHVFPRFTGDELYASHAQRRRTTAEERRPYAEKLRAYFATH